MISSNKKVFFEDTTYQEKEEISLKLLILKLKQLVDYVSSKWIVLLLFVLLGCIVGGGYAYWKKATYIATTTFVLESGDNAGGGFSQYAGLASMVGIDLGGSGGGLFQGDNILELYTSRTMIEQALLSEVTSNGRQELLVDSYLRFKNLKEYWSKHQPTLNQIDFRSSTKTVTSRVRDSVLNVIVDDIRKNYLSVSKPDKKLSIIKVKVSAVNEFFAQEFNNQIVKKVNEFYVATKTKKSIENLSILQHQTDSIKSVLNSAINRTVAVADATPNLNPTRQILRAPAQRSQFNAEANKAILTELVKNLELSKISLRKETPLIQIIDSPILPLEKDQLSVVKTMLIGGVTLGFAALVVLVLINILKGIA